jgi:hypothetical protein
VLEALRILRVRRKRRFNHLERHVAAKPAVACAVHLTHPTRPEERQDVISGDPSTGQSRTRLSCKGPRRLGECRTLEKLSRGAVVAEQ